jgi:hypothetical protein
VVGELHHGVVREWHDEEERHRLPGGSRRLLHALLCGRRGRPRTSLRRPGGVSSSPVTVGPTQAVTATGRLCLSSSCWRHLYLATKS